MERTELERIVRATGLLEERAGFFFLADPALAARAEASKRQPAVDGPDIGWLCIATGGSSGGLKFARHDERTLGAAVRGFCAHFGIERVNAVDVLPAFHVSGLMARVRCAATGGEHLAWEWGRLQAGERPPLRGAREWVLSLVPTQLQRLIASPAGVDWLRRFRVILIGGGPLWPALADEAARLGLRLAPSYGMTETAAMVTALRPEEFLAGTRSSGTPLPHARVAVDAEGRVRVSGQSLFRGYYPGAEAAREFTTEDLGRIDERGHLQVFGRRDAAIITGGEKVHPAEIEAALRASGEFSDVAVIGVPDADWGEIVVACYPADDSPASSPNVARAVEILAPFQRPKRFFAIPQRDWPRNAQGKVNRPALQEKVRRNL